MTNLSALLNGPDAGNTIIMVSADQIKKLIEDVTANTRRIVEEQYQPRYFTMEQMQELFSLKSQATIYNWIKSGKIRGYKMEEGGRTYFDQAEVREAMKKGVIGRYVHK